MSDIDPYLPSLPRELVLALNNEVTEPDLVVGINQANTSEVDSATYTIQLTDNVLFVDSTAAPVTVNLLSATDVSGRVFNIIHTVPVNVLTVQPSGAETINNLTSVELAGDLTIRSLSIVSDGNNYWIL